MNERKLQFLRDLHTEVVNSQLSGIQCRVLFALCRLSVDVDENETAPISQPNLANLLPKGDKANAGKISVVSIKVAIRALKKAGFIMEPERKGRGSNSYTVTIPKRAQRRSGSGSRRKVHIGRQG